MLCELTPARSRTSTTRSALLNRVFPGFEREIAGKDVLDFGCGAGFQSVAMAKCGARSVLGLDTNPKTLARARDLAARQGLGDRLQFADNLEDNCRGKFDVVISQNSMEHFPDPVAVLDVDEVRAQTWRQDIGHVRSAVAGALRQPHALLHAGSVGESAVSETVVMKVRSRFINDGAMRYEDVEGGLNKMTLRKFERLLAQCGLHAS